MKELSDFFNMGGYAGYVWPSYVLTFAVVVLNVVWARRLFARSREEARRRLAMRSGTTGTGGAGTTPTQAGEAT
jgi:heme exporter protein D